MQEPQVPDLWRSVYHFFVVHMKADPLKLFRLVLLLSALSGTLELQAKDLSKLKNNNENRLASSDSKTGGKSVSDIYSFKANALDGTAIDFNKYKGEVLLIVNTASKCGYTPQYKGLEELHKKFGSKGLKVLGFPCNQFGAQEPGSSDEIGAFCQRNYGVEFQMFEKIDVNGKDAHPLYRYLTGAENGDIKPIKWNFTKFLVDKHGVLVKRYEPDTKPEDIAADIESRL